MSTDLGTVLEYINQTTRTVWVWVANAQGYMVWARVRVALGEGRYEVVLPNGDIETRELPNDTRARISQ